MERETGAGHQSKPARAGLWRVNGTKAYSAMWRKLLWDIHHLVGAEINNEIKIEDKPRSDDFGSVHGMSGGFVIELTPGMAMRKYHWVGVQSSQTTDEWNGKTRLKLIKYVNSLAVLALVDDFIRGIIKNENSQDQNKDLAD